MCRLINPRKAKGFFISPIGQGGGHFDPTLETPYKQTKKGAKKFLFSFSKSLVYCGFNAFY